MKNRTVIMFFLLMPLSSIAKNISFSFDDGFNPNTNINAQKHNGQILNSLAKNNVTAIYYVTGHKVDSELGLKLVSEWGYMGHDIANHSYSHKNYSSTKISAKEYIFDIEKNHDLLKK